MINKLDVPGTDLWKYVDDRTILEMIKNQDSEIQDAVDTLHVASHPIMDKFQLNETKTVYKL